MRRRCPIPGARPIDWSSTTRRAPPHLETSNARPPAPLLLWTAMKEGLLGGTLHVSPRSESKEARTHVARWPGSESPKGRRLPALRRRRDRRRVGLAPDADGRRGLAARAAMWGGPVRGE